MGQAGAYLGDAALFLFGLPAIFLLPLMLIFARRLWRDVPQPQWKRQLMQCLVGMLLMGFGMAYWQHGSDIGLPAGWGGTIALLADSGVTSLVGRIDGGLGTLVRVLLILSTLLGGIALVVRSLQLERPLFRIPAIPMPRFPGRPAAEAGDGGDYVAPLVEAKPPRKAVEPENRKPPVIDDRNSAPKKAAFSTGARQGDFFGSYTLPSLDLLDPPPAVVRARSSTRRRLEANARLAGIGAR